MKSAENWVVGFKLGIEDTLDIVGEDVFDEWGYEMEKIRNMGW